MIEMQGFFRRTGSRQIKATIRSARHQNALLGFNPPRDRNAAPRRWPQVRHPFAILPFSDSLVAGHPKPPVTAGANAQNISIGCRFLELKRIQLAIFQG